MMSSANPVVYRGRLAPSPTGYLHLGHARTFWTAQQRARAEQGVLVYREDDLDRARVRPEYAVASREDLRWFGLEWQEGPDVGGPYAPYVQSQRQEHYRAALQRLQTEGLVYPCRCSRQDVLRALTAPHQGEEEPIYPGTCLANPPAPTDRVNWRFRVPVGEDLTFVDGGCGPQRFTAGYDFGDFVVWRADDFPAYHLACVVDDAMMAITEVVRGADLLASTARQLLLYRALHYTVPAFYHCPLVTDENGQRLAKRHDALALRQLRARGLTPEAIKRRMKDESEG